MTRRVGCGGIAGDRERLTAAAAEIDLAPIAAPAGLLHPVRAAERLEGLAPAPDVRQRPIPNIFEHEAGERLCGMARQRASRRRDDDDRPGPSAHAGLRPRGIMVVSDKVETQDACQTLFRFVDYLRGGEEFLAGGNQRGAVLLRPGVELNMRDLDS